MSWTVSQMNVSVANVSNLGAMINDFIAKPVAGYWLMCQGCGKGSVELSMHKLLNPVTKLLKPSDDLLRPKKAKTPCGGQPKDYERQLGTSGGGRCV